MYRIQSNLFGGFTLYREDVDGLTKLNDYPSLELAEAAREALENQPVQQTMAFDEDNQPRKERTKI